MTAAGLAPHLRLLGRFRLERGATAVDVCAGGRRLLAYLGLHRRATRTVLAGALWPDATEERAHGSLRTTLWRLHRSSGPLIRSDRDTLSLEDSVIVDAQALAESARRVVDGDQVPHQLLFDGDLLPGWDEHWVVFERERLRQLRLHALDALAVQFITQGRPALALEAALESVRVEPLRESAHRLVVCAHLAEDNVTEAARHFRSFRDLLRRELGVEPSARLTSALPLAP